MSKEFREATVARLQFADEQAKADFLADDGSGVNSDVVALAALLVEHAGHPILITAARRDHGPDGNSPHSHQAGDAFDFWVADWQSAGDSAIGDALKVLAQIAREGGPVYEVGLGGRAQNFNPGGWPAGFDLFDDNSTDHVHVSAAPVRAGLVIAPPKAPAAGPEPDKGPSALAPEPAAPQAIDMSEIAKRLAAIGERLGAVEATLYEVLSQERITAQSIEKLREVLGWLNAAKADYEAMHDAKPLDDTLGGGPSTVDGYPQQVSGPQPGEEAATQTSEE